MMMPRGSWKLLTEEEKKVLARVSKGLCQDYCPEVLPMKENKPFGL